MIELLRRLLDQIRASREVRRASQDSTPSLLERLTPRQRDMVSLLSAGATNRQIAAQLFLSERTVAEHLENAYRRLGVTNRTTAATELRRSAY